MGDQKSNVCGIEHFGFKVVNLQRFIDKMERVFGETMRVEKELSGAVLIYLNEDTPLQVRQAKAGEEVNNQFKPAIAVRDTLAFAGTLQKAGIIPDMRRWVHVGVIDFEIDGVKFHTVQVND